ncbi:MAG: hypothetical protein HWE13_06730 [Gammaproteobacteria bacterium]|nr:hypothetical protein [Gammaproteobacteria bacterium]NVK87802.1 hypothetical protein [Gammaproteobacteria bacterium]
MFNAEIGHWYRITGMTDPVEIITIDDQDDRIELQHYDGLIESLDFTDWQALAPIEIETPEEWSAPFDHERFDVHPNELFLDYNPRDAVPVKLLKSA